MNVIGNELRFMIGNMSVEIVNLKAQLVFAQNYIRELEERLEHYGRERREEPAE